MEYLIAIDLEGIHGVVGEPYGKLSKDSPYHAPAAEAAALELNAAIKALFDNGATKVAVWDNHGGGNNIDFSKVDPRAIKIEPKGCKFRFDFVREHNFSHILFMGYHAMEGTPKGVLAHTFNSTAIQYVKLNGKGIGELGIDSYICQTHGITPIFVSSDHKGVEEMREIFPAIRSVTTKYGIRRNEAKLKERETVLKEIYDEVTLAVTDNRVTHSPAFPRIAHLEVRYTRAEHADEVYDRNGADGTIPMYRGEDSHVLCFEVERPQYIPKLF